MNYYDAVPRVPVHAPVNDCCTFRLKNFYTHVGFGLVFRTGRKLQVSHTQMFDSWKAFRAYVSKNCCRLCFTMAFLCTTGKGFGLNALRNHSCSDYYELIRENEDELLGLNLDDMYKTITKGDVRKTWLRNDAE